MKRFPLAILAFFFLCQYTYAQFPASSKVFCYKPAYKETIEGERKPANDGKGFDKYYFVMFGDNCMAFENATYAKASSNYSDDHNYYYKKLSSTLADVPDRIARGNKVVGLKKKAEGETRYIAYYPDKSSIRQTAYRERTIYTETSISYNLNSISLYETHIVGESEWRWVNKTYYFKNDQSMFVFEYEGARYYFEQIDINVLDTGRKSYEMF